MTSGDNLNKVNAKKLDELPNQASTHRHIPFFSMRLSGTNQIIETTISLTHTKF